MEQQPCTCSFMKGTKAGASVVARTDAVAVEYVARTLSTSDYTPPTQGLMRGQRPESNLGAFVGDLQIETLDSESRCVSVDLLRRRKKIHDRGSAAEAVRGSVGRPGFFPPRVCGESLHVDGCVLDNLPVRALARTEGPIFAEDIGSGASSGSATATGPCESPLSATRC